MALAAATAGTWGIGGWEFLLVYLVIATAVLVAGTRTRRALADPGVTGPVGDLTARPHDVAYLNGGADLAVYSALSAMHLRDAITSSRGIVRSVGRPEPGAEPLEHAVHVTTAAPMHRRRLPFHRPVQHALAAIEQRLVADGLLLPEEQRRRITQVGLWMLAVAVLGLVRMLADIAAARPVGPLVVVLLAVSAVAAVQLAWAPRRTRLGDRVLADLRARHHDLHPDVRPDRAGPGPAGAALAVAIYGTSALWASDPEFADEIAAQRVIAGGSTTAAVGGGTDGGCGADGGGCGG